MDMEQRVKTLEQEMKILKNQVQKTLLDIQEQILVHYHPALRTEDDALEENGKAQKETARPFTPPASNMQRSSESAGAPKVRQVSLADLRQPQPQGTRPSAEPAQPAAPPASEEQTFAALAEWVGESVSKIGAERTRKLLDLRTANGSVAPDVYDTLHQLITLCEADEGAEATETAVLLQQLSHLLK